MNYPQNFFNHINTVGNNLPPTSQVVAPTPPVNNHPVCAVKCLPELTPNINDVMCMTKCKDNKS